MAGRVPTHWDDEEVTAVGDRDLRVPPGRWWTMDGRVGMEELIIQPIGPELQATQRDCVVVTGWRELPGEWSREFVTVHIQHPRGHSSG